MQSNSTRRKKEIAVKNKIKKRRETSSGRKVKQSKMQGVLRKTTVGKDLKVAIRDQIKGMCPNESKILMVTRVSSTTGREQRKRVRSFEEFDKAMRQLRYNFGGLYKGIDKFYDYNAEGEQKASTIVIVGGQKKGEYKTSLQKHAEMRAIEKLLTDGDLKFNIDGTLSAESDIEFKTDIPNCGFCTAILNVLGVGALLTKPTKGKFLLASNGNYPLPDMVRVNRKFWENLTGINTEEMLDYLFQGDSRNYDDKWKDFIENKPYHFKSFTVNIFKKLAEAL